MTHPDMPPPPDYFSDEEKLEYELTWNRLERALWILMTACLTSGVFGILSLIENEKKIGVYCIVMMIVLWVIFVVVESVQQSHEGGERKR